PIHDPQLAFEFNHLLGTALSKAGDYSNAIKQLAAAQAIKTDYISNNLALAEAHFKQQNYHEAEQQLSRITPSQLKNNTTALFSFHELKGNLADFRADFEQAAHHYQLAKNQADKLNQPLLLARIIQEQANSLNLQDRNQEAV